MEIKNHEKIYTVNRKWSKRETRKSGGVMITDSQLLKIVKDSTFFVYVCSNKDNAPRVTVRNVDVPTKKEAISFGHAYALRILGLARKDYSIQVFRNKD